MNAILIHSAAAVCASCATHAVAELARQGVSAPDKVLDSLIARRLLTPEQRRGIQFLEIPHDVLVRSSFADGKSVWRKQIALRSNKEIISASGSIGQQLCRITLQAVYSFSQHWQLL
jgi:hypothetical protein